ncbi:hypothetical protein K1T71_007727 [Dendrolimus kikuchii]|uniref:Uncharacterized protein n=1 Tax=Dendrolimus kikuchii TaxID=765133 RepID=A0ACC1CYW9_9NEOP|nr:hypothetical protein K1T71_007727 [Dendrolimus kikuchii]
MSRLIIKNLPNKVTLENLKQLFGEKGEVTDVQLKYTKDGKFRNFGFVGYRTEEQACAAKEYFDGTCIRSMKIQVETCANLGDEKKPRAWSKYAPDSNAYRSLHKDEIDEKDRIKKGRKKLSKAEKNKNKVKELLRKHKDDPLFAEFIQAHVNDKTAWIKEAFEQAAKSDDDSGVEEENDEILQIKSDKKEININDIDKPEETESNIKDSTVESKVKQSKNVEKVANKQISDLEYMKILMKKVDKSLNNSTESTDIVERRQEKPKKVRNRPLLHVKITGLPFLCKKKDIKEFFRPIVPYSIRLPHNKGKKIAGFCYVGFRTEKELKKALNKDKLFLGNHRLHIHKYEDKAKKEAEEQEETKQKKNQLQANNEESIGESGSIFVRNLPYVVSEDELTHLFEKYGPLAEVNMPVDPVLRQPKGFATITFMMPEHAVKAYSELDGTSFCGRMLHLLPAKTEKLDKESDDEGLSFKEKKAKKLKAQAKSSHNWNVLFLGANAVADVVAANYNTTKEQLLSDNNKSKYTCNRKIIGIINITTIFIKNNSIALPAKKRSKSCILVKNLPANTEKEEIKTLFEKHGHIARFLMPKHGITALVDFVEPFEAKKAFTKLAYSQFKSAPLYLEWAPENVFIKTSEKTSINEEETSIKGTDKHDKKYETAKATDDYNDSESKATKAEESVEILEEPENDTTLFVKNLNFKTNEDVLKSHFSDFGKIHSVTIAKKKDPKNLGQFLSMGYGFVQFYKNSHATEALKFLQSSTLDGKTLELKRSQRGNTNEVKTARKTSKDTGQEGTKILVRNVPFQANKNELSEIFRAFGEIKTLRLPKKLTPGSDQHRGFAFVDYHSKADAKTAFQALCQSTHLYGRRLVLEWADQTDESEDVNQLRKRTAQTFNAKTPGGKKSRKSAIDTEKFVDGENNEM